MRGRSCNLGIYVTYSSLSEGGGPYLARKPSAILIEGALSRSKNDMSGDCADVTSPPGSTILEWNTKGCLVRASRGCVPRPPRPQRSPRPRGPRPGRGEYKGVERTARIAVAATFTNVVAPGTVTKRVGNLDAKSVGGRLRCLNTGRAAAAPCDGRRRRRLLLFRHA
jgi:hypothetical protein